MFRDKRHQILLRDRWERRKSMAFIAYGWESKEFYRKWLKRDDPETIRELQGPILNFGSPQTKFAPALLESVHDAVLKDPLYLARLKRHYQIFKEKVDPKHFRKSAVTGTSRIAPSTSLRTSNPTYANSNEKDIIPSAKKPRKRHRS